jgi:hypothetical protein
MTLMKAADCIADIGKNPTIDRFRIILTMRYHNLRLLIHRAILLRLCELIDDCDDARNSDTLVLQDIARSTAYISIESATEMIGIVRTLVETQWAQRGLLGVWWCALYHSALLLFLLFCPILVFKLGANRHSIRRGLYYLHGFPPREAIDVYNPASSTLYALAESDLLRIYRASTTLGRGKSDDNQML